MGNNLGNGFAVDASAFYRIFDVLAPIGYYLVDFRHQGTIGAEGYGDVTDTFEIANVSDKDEKIALISTYGKLYGGISGSVRTTTIISTLKITVTTKDPEEFNTWLADVRTTSGWSRDLPKDGLFNLQVYLLASSSPSRMDKITFGIVKQVDQAHPLPRPLTLPLSFSATYERVDRKVIEETLPTCTLPTCSKPQKSWSADSR